MCGHEPPVYLLKESISVCNCFVVAISSLLQQSDRPVPSNKICQFNIEQIKLLLLLQYIDKTAMYYFFQTSLVIGFFGSNVPLQQWLY